jgi:Cytochrome P450
LPARKLIYHPEIENLIQNQTQGRVFRIDENTVGIADGGLARKVLALRPILDFERTIFKPVSRNPVPRTLSAMVMKALAADVKNTLGQDFPARSFDGLWPHSVFMNLSAAIYGKDLWHLKVLVRGPSFRSASAIWALEKFSLLSSRLFPSGEASALSKLVQDALTPSERRLATTLYRRTSSALCSSVASLVTNAVWLAAPISPDMPVRNVLLETLRLLPPAWMLLRTADPVYCSAHKDIRQTDNIYVLPLLCHRDPESWDQVTLFKPERWDGVEDPDLLPSYLPFGYADDRCWARQLVISLAGKVLEEVSRGRLSVDDRQRTAKIPLAPLLTVSRVRVVQTDVHM